MFRKMVAVRERPHGETDPVDSCRGTDGAGTERVGNVPRSNQRFEIAPRGPYRLAETIRFLEGFPAAGVPARPDAVLRLAFVVDGTDHVAAVNVRQPEPDESVLVGMTSEAPEPDVLRQVARFLSLDHDGSGFPGVGRRDQVIGRLQARHPGFRPTGFWSPFEAAVWAVTSHRIQMVQAAKVKAEIGRRFGTVVHHDGHDLVAFPAPLALAEADLSSIVGLGGRKPEWLRGLALAAMDGALDVDGLRSLPADDALAALQRLAGVGPFSAELILIRGAMTVDVAPASEGRFGRALSAAYGLPGPIGDTTVTRITGGWAPFRTWTSFLVRSVGESPTPSREPR